MSIVRRVFSEDARHPFDCVEWETRTAEIRSEAGDLIFSLPAVEFPVSWSELSSNIVASKYFQKDRDEHVGERSLKQVLRRVCDTIALGGSASGYFEDTEHTEIFKQELTSLLLGQYCSFNSPVWFNVGIEQNPQCSACFILSVDDSIDSLLELQKTEVRIFKYGSGCGSNLSAIRSTRETLSGGGVPSGPLAFMRGFDAWARSIKSGGKTRRAAKMQLLDCTHGDIRAFVQAKQKEEAKARALIAQGYDGSFNIPEGAYDSVDFQNSNFSVRVTDSFMQAVVEENPFTTKSRGGKALEELDAAQLLADIAKGTWVCGDPGLQFDTTINAWNTCPESGRINASNPCGEYMHLDNSACNLASINLLRFLTSEGEFETERFCAAIDILIRAQDILVDVSGYPTEAIERNARAFRQLGLGYTNLGALLMSLGLPYDSNEGRAVAASISALMSGQAYLSSALLASDLGAFSGYEQNKDAMLQVIEKHKQAADSLAGAPEFPELKDRIQAVWSAAYEEGKRYGYRNAQTTVLAPTGTISFMMDCDTSGIEPDVALLKYKKLSGGGDVRMINSSIARGLKHLGYREDDIGAFLEHIASEGTAEGSDVLKPEHLAVFDCAFRASPEGRAISPLGHIEMMTVVQPFISGAISKTINLPEEVTVEEIFALYVAAWRKGLKAITMYRNNSRYSQPLSGKRKRDTDIPDGDIHPKNIEDTVPPAQEHVESALSAPVLPTQQGDGSGGHCLTCGSPRMIKQGSCYLCYKCGTQGGCA